MSNLDVTEIVPRLIGELGYSPFSADMAARELLDADPRVQEAFWQWWSTDQVAPLTIAGYNIPRLAAEHGMNPVAALLTLDWLIKEPEAALASLKRGHDRLE